MKNVLVKNAVNNKKDILFRSILIRPARILFSVIGLTLLASCASFSFEPTYSQKWNIKHIVLISIDGLRPDAFNNNNAANLTELSQNGLYYSAAQTIELSVTIPSHISMLTGLDGHSHKITENKSLNGYLTVPTVQQILKNNGMTTAAFFSKKKLNYLFPPSSIDFIYGPGYSGTKYHQATAGIIAEQFASYWKKHAYNLTFIHLREPDVIGHKYGWMSNEYLNQAIPDVDQAIGRIVRSIRNSEYVNNTLLIITADHGGKGKNHWYKRPEDTTIPWMIVSPLIKAESIVGKGVRIYDTAPTVLYLLGITVPEGLDGRVIPRIKQLFKVNAD